jgi:hypothetical protein
MLTGTPIQARWVDIQSVTVTRTSGSFENYHSFSTHSQPSGRLSAMLFQCFEEKLWKYIVLTTYFFTPIHCLPSNTRSSEQSARALVASALLTTGLQIQRRPVPGRGQHSQGHCANDAGAPGESIVAHLHAATHQGGRRESAAEDRDDDSGAAEVRRGVGSGCEAIVAGAQSIANILSIMMHFYHTPDFRFQYQHCFYHASRKT